MAGAPKATDVAILTGGESTRMGQDKALLSWGSGQLLDHAIATTRSLDGVADIFVVGRREAYQGRGAVVIADDYPQSGPLGGIATALRYSSAGRVLVLAVDMPYLSPALLNAMLALDLDADAIVPDAGGLQPLHAIYQRSCLAAIEAQINAGRLKISDVFEHIEVAYLGWDWIGRFDPEGRSFENANTPAEYDRLRSSGRGELEVD